MSFFRHPDAEHVARALIGRHLFTRIDGTLCGGLIVETEAYGGITDRASHAYNGRRTARTEPMFHDGGVAYVYLCYGMHHCFNVVTNRAGKPDAVLVRALQPTHNIGIMRQRRGERIPDTRLTRGPGSLARALGITRADTGLRLNGSRLWIATRAPLPPPEAIDASPRIGVDYAGADARRPWRFTLRNSPWLSRPPTDNSPAPIMGRSNHEDETVGTRPIKAYARGGLAEQQTG